MKLRTPAKQSTDLHWLPQSKSKKKVTKHPHEHSCRVWCIKVRAQKVNVMPPVHQSTRSNPKRREARLESKPTSRGQADEPMAFYHMQPTGQKRTFWRVGSMQIKISTPAAESRFHKNSLQGAGILCDDDGGNSIQVSQRSSPRSAENYCW